MANSNGTGGGGVESDFGGVATDFDADDAAGSGTNVPCGTRLWSKVSSRNAIRSAVRSRTARLCMRSADIRELRVSSRNYIHV